MKHLRQRNVTIVTGASNLKPICFAISFPLLQLYPLSANKYLFLGLHILFFIYNSPILGISLNFSKNFNV